MNSTFDKIERHIQIVIAERRVLLRIEHFHQRRRRIAPEIAAELVDLVQHQDGVHRLGPANSLDDLPRQRADVRAPVSADFRFVVHSAQRNAHEFAAHRARDRFPERSFAHARRPDEAQDRPLHSRLQFFHRQVIEQALLHLHQVVVILVEDLLRLADVDGFLARAGSLVPWQRGHPFQIGPRHHVFGRSRSHLRQALQFALAFLLRFGGHARLFHLLAKLVDFRDSVVGFAQLLLNGLHLLAQQEFALALVHLLLNLLVNLVAQLEHFLFLGKLAHQRFQPLADVEGFEQFLAHHGVERRQRRSHEIGQPRRRIDIHHFGLQIVGKLRRTRHHFPEQLLHVALERRQFRIALISKIRLHLHPRPHERLQADHFEHTDAVQALQKRHHVAVGHAHHLVNLGQRSTV